jgi:hypothetical protein
LHFKVLRRKATINAARDNYPLCALVQLADGMAANLLEFGTNEEEELTW